MWNLISSGSLPTNSTSVSEGRSLQGGPLFQFRTDNGENFPICKYNYKLVGTGNPETGSYTDNPGYNYESEEEIDYFTGNFLYLYEILGNGYEFDSLTEVFSFEQLTLVNSYIAAFNSDFEEATYLLLSEAPSDLTSFPTNSSMVEVEVPDVFEVVGVNENSIETLVYELNDLSEYGLEDLSKYTITQIESQGLLFVPDTSNEPHTFEVDLINNVINVYAKNTCKPLQGSTFTIEFTQESIDPEYSKVFQCYVFDYSTSTINYAYIDAISYENKMFVTDYNYPISNLGLIYNPTIKIALGLWQLTAE